MATKKKVKHWDNLVLNMKDLIDNVIKAKKVSGFFKDKVDEIAHGAPNYYIIIKHPMYLNKMLVSELGHFIYKKFQRKNSRIENINSHMKFAMTLS